MSTMTVDIVRALGSVSSATSVSPTTIPIKVEFRGGLQDTLSDGMDHSNKLNLKNDINVELPIPLSGAATVDSLISHLMEIFRSQATGKSKFATRDELATNFVVCVNQADWALEEKEETPMEAGNTVTFIKRTHAG